jgi:hypothetical protein
MSGYQLSFKAYSAKLDKVDWVRYSSLSINRRTSMDISSSSRWQQFCVTAGVTLVTTFAIPVPAQDTESKFVTFTVPGTI